MHAAQFIIRIYSTDVRRRKTWLSIRFDLYISFMVTISCYFQSFKLYNFHEYLMRSSCRWRAPICISYNNKVMRCFFYIYILLRCTPAAAGFFKKHFRGSKVLRAMSSQKWKRMDIIHYNDTTTHIDVVCCFL